ncbi:MAG TPA: hypothetical protein VLL98_05960 [Rickettsiales bacterium]|nr:hypothetical protein [Rickettsiales bacterium]
MNNLNKELEKSIERKVTKVEEINIKPLFFLLLSVGIQIVIVYMFFIYLVGDLLASYLGFNNLYLLSIILGTLANINAVIKIVKGFKNVK